MTFRSRFRRLAATRLETMPMVVVRHTRVAGRICSVILFMEIRSLLAQAGLLLFSPALKKISRTDSGGITTKAVMRLAQT